MTTASKTEGISMLDAMVGRSMDAKAKAMSPNPPGALTPLVGEAQVALPNHPVLGTLTEDPATILPRLAEARRELEAALTAIGRLEVMWGKPAEAMAAAVEVEVTLTKKELERREQDVRDAASAGPAASKADKAKAARAQARIDAQSPLEELVKGEEAKLRTKAELLAQMMAADPAEVEAVSAEAERFKKEFAAKAAAAQAATFTPTPTTFVGTESLDAAGQETYDDPTDGWVCPAHGKFVERKSPRREVVFRVCPEQGCSEFEKV